MKDTFVAGAIAGVASSIVSWVVEWLLSFAGVIPIITYQYIDILILPPAHGIPYYERLGAALLAALTASVFLGVLQVYLYQCTGSESWLLKGAAYGGIIFIVHVSLIPKLWEPRILPVLDHPGVIVWEIVSKVGWGILSGYLIGRLYTHKRMPAAPS